MSWIPKELLTKLADQPDFISFNETRPIKIERPSHWGCNTLNHDSGRAVCLEYLKAGMKWGHCQSCCQYSHDILAIRNAYLAFNQKNNKNL